MLVLLRESTNMESGVGALRVLPECVEIDFPDRERLVIEWAAIAGVALAQEGIGRKWKVELDLGNGLDAVVIYPLADDGVSMAADKQSAQKLLTTIESARPPQDL